MTQYKPYYRSEEAIAQKRRQKRDAIILTAGIALFIIFAFIGMAYVFAVVSLSLLV